MENQTQVPPIQASSSPVPPAPKRTTNKLVFILGGIILLFLVASGSYYLGSIKNGTPKDEVHTPTQTISSEPPTTLTKQGHIVNLASGEMTLPSPDGTKITTFINNQPSDSMGDGSSLFTEISLQDTASRKTMKYEITGPLLSAEGPIFWSPLDNRLYFTHGTNGIGTYALWSSKIDGTDPVLLSGNTDEPPYKSATVLENSPIYGATEVRFSKNGRLIFTVKLKENLTEHSKIYSFWEMNYDGSNAHAITTDEYTAQRKNTL